MQVCSNCGEENPTRFRLCGFCGTPLVQALPQQEVRKTVTIVFSDLQGSTSLGEKLDSESLREVLSRYFAVMRSVLEEHGLAGAKPFEAVGCSRCAASGYRGRVGVYEVMTVSERIRALILDSVYDDPEQMLRVGVEHNGLGKFPLMIRSTQISFGYLNNGHRNDPPLSTKLLALNGVPTLFIQALDDPELAATTRDMFLKAPEPREQAIIAHGNFVGLSDQEKREYENRVVSFFLLRLPPTVAKPLR